MARTHVIAGAVLVLLMLSPAVYADESTHTYELHEEIPLWANKIGPFHNPQETYQFYTLPFCQPKEDEVHPPHGIGEVLEGNELHKSLISIQFLDKVDNKEYCKIPVTDRTAKIFQEAVRRQYWYQLLIDDLPMWGMLGVLVAPEDDPAPTAAEGIPYMYTHKRFDIAVNGNQIIEANLTSENLVEIKSGEDLPMTYSVHWVNTKTEFAYRYNRYLDFNFFEHQVHWFSIFNSFMMVIFLTGLVALILMRTLKNDYAKYQRNDDLADFDADMTDESGWKQVSADVFRPPAHLELFCAVVGTGSQLVLLVLVCVLFAVGRQWEVSRAKLITAVIMWYAVTSLYAGYVSGSLYHQSHGKQWIRTMVMTAGLFPGLVFVVGFCLNSVAIVYTSLAAMPIGTIITVVLLWCCLAFPLTLFGTVIGKNWNGTIEYPCRINAIPRQIPDKPWYLNSVAVALAGGVLPFGSIFIEMYFIFNSFWRYKFYYVYGFMLLVLVILVVVCVCVTIVATYFLLNAEDYRWPWQSFFSAASTSFYVFLYAIYFFFAKTQMSGFFQTVFYFGYMGLFCVAFGMLCGTIGFKGSQVFIHAIYSNIKSD
eukprot:TRINITY_DN738_c0_g1_i2.p1 TRINITY_DN738_c0_g1~~TRINITY_DN738_c0_g1_i2.p1  ORF type:complete len:642 (-),score=157.54 TRINITY_DN738_c0_g1_i2:148-1926(-)